MWVPLVENNEHRGPGADFFVRQHINQIFSRNKNIDTLLLACTHYPLLKEKIEQFLPPHVTLLSQGQIVAESLEDYLRRHPEMEARLSRNGRRTFFTTDAPEEFNKKASLFFGANVESGHAEM